MHTLQVQALRVFLRALRTIPSRAIAMVTPPPTNDHGVKLDPHSHLFASMRDRIPEDLSADGAARERALLNRYATAIAGDAPRLVRTRDIKLADLPARMYRPLRPILKDTCVLYFHGGGWVVGNLDTHDGVCRRLAKRLSCAVISVDYRLAPEFPFPAAFDDALASYREAVARARELGFDATRIAVAGDSAGGNLATAVAIATREDRPPLAQLLIYPVTDVSREHPSYDLFVDGVLSRARMRWFRDRYLGADVKTEDPRASPLCMDDLSRLCPALVVTAGFDVLRDEGLAYAERLKQAQNHVTTLHYPHLPHAFFTAEPLSNASGAAALETAERFRDLLITQQAQRR